MGVDDLVQVEEGIVSRRIFADQAIYEMELDRIFSRCWLYLGHVTQLQHPGDFFTTYMGEDQVIVTLGSSGRIRAFLNSCRHRGTRVCRVDAGNAKTFVCPYHGWSYNIDGELVGVPRFETAYFGELNKAERGLVEVAQLDTFSGLIFATWDPEAPPLPEYLGDIAVYLDLMLNRIEGGLEVLGGVQKWLIPVNWKIGNENFLGDVFHLPVTHGSAMELGLRARMGERGHMISVRGGHGFGSEEGGIHRGDSAGSSYPDFINRLRERVAAERGEFADHFVPLGHGSIFPNLSFLDAMRFRTLRVWQPRGPDQVEVYAWCLVDRALPDDLKEATRKQYIMLFGPGGMFEVDDGEIWGSITAALRGRITRRQVFDYQMGLGHERRVADVYGHGLPGTFGDWWSESNHREFYRTWREYLSSNSGSETARSDNASRNDG